MKLAIFSDLHNEFTPWVPPESVKQADVVILAGDIDVGDKGVLWATKTFHQPVIYVPGNHEYYKGVYQAVLKKMKAAADNTNVHLLNNREVTIDGTKFIGSTLWTDFDLCHTKATSALFAKDKMHDYRVIRFNQGGRYRKLTVGDTVRLHSEAILFLKQQLASAKTHNQDVVVVSHHAPSAQSIMPDYKLDKLSPAYCSNLDDILHEFEPQLWIHGHTHYNVDYHVGKSRVISNQRGYVPEERIKNFNESYIVEI
ncbi:metallophosphoesterase [Colwellia sp. E150_009]